MDKMARVQSLLERYQQGHLLMGFEKVSKFEQDELLRTIESIDFELVEELYQGLSKGSKTSSQVTISPVKSANYKSLSDLERTVSRLYGEKAIYDGELAVVTMAGGQGTRLGFDGPKGAFIFDKENNKSIFEALAETLKKVCDNYYVNIPWYIMCSNENILQTRKFFSDHFYFDYPGEILFFVQGEMPMLDRSGKILLDENYQIKMAANGHGGTLQSMERSGMIDDMKERGIKWVSINGVDNVLAKPVDPIFLGLAIMKKAKAGIKSIEKAYPEEKVGVVCLKNGRVGVVEYTEISEEMANERGDNGELVYGDAYALFSLFSMEGLDRISRLKLPYHAAYKKADFYNSDGQWIAAENPNAIKFEQFIFDAYELFDADDVCVFRTNREEEFAPIKNATGVDSPETALKLYRAYHSKKHV
jgi:UDP-N-acetylglucosamine/UDP-N-acetylgalactosamine diphosphorylase